jgi:hypothetical protein
MNKNKSRNNKFKNKNNKFNSKKKLSHKKRSIRTKTIKGGTVPLVKPVVPPRPASTFSIRSVPVVPPRPASTFRTIPVSPPRSNSSLNARPVAPPRSIASLRKRNAVAEFHPPIGVISYNISWGSMTGNVFDRTAAKLAAFCAEKTKKENPSFQVGDRTVCLDNVQLFLQREVSDPKKNICFIGLQEAANWMHIWQDGGLLQNMGFVNHTIQNRGNVIDLTTLYDATQFKVLGAKCGNLTPGTDGRPYHIIFLRRLSNGKIYIFINFHNGHNIIPTVLQTQLSNDVDNIIDLSHETGKNFVNIETNTNIIPLSNIINSDSGEVPFVIVVGDTNDHGKRTYFTGIQPFVDSSIIMLKNIVVKSESTPPLTCCRDSPVDPHDKYGDYIMINDKLKYVVENKIPDINMNYAENPQSDHLPIYSSVEEK